MSTHIPVTKGRHAIVDDADYAWLSQWSWHCSSSGYAVRMSPRPNRREIYMHRLILDLSFTDEREQERIRQDVLQKLADKRRTAEFRA